MGLSNNINEQLERIYIAKTGNVATVYHRPTYEYIFSCSIEELDGRVKELLAMDIKDFYRYLFNHKVNLPNKKSINQPHTHKDNYLAEKESWVQGAWLPTTEKLLKTFKVENVIEAVPYDFIEELKEEKNKKALDGWNVGVKKRTIINNITHKHRKLERRNVVKKERKEETKSPASKDKIKALKKKVKQLNKRLVKH